MAEKALEQPTFIWEGADRRGTKVKGETQAGSIALVKAELRRQGINPTKVRKKSKPLFSGKKRITPKDIAVFSRQLSTMISSGVPLVQGLDIISRGHENPSLRELVANIKTDIEGGSSLAEALAKHPYYFDELFCNLVAAGESGGVLDSLLDKIATYKEKTEALKGKIKKALFYPAAVIVVAVVVTAILLIFVIPQFEDLFSSFGADLPAFTRLVIGISEFVRSWSLLIFGGMIGAGVAFWYGKKRSTKFNRALDRLVLRIPVIGMIMHKASIARFARTLSVMFAAGVPLVDALKSVAGATGNSVYGDAVLQIRDQVEVGQQLQQAMRNTALFPHMVVQMVGIGEEAGSVDSMLAKVADFYEEEVDNAVDAMSSLIEPFIIAFLGIVVGGLVVAMYLPIFKLGSVV